MDLYEFLVDSELQHYYNSIKNELKILLVSHLKFATDEDLRQVGLSKPEIRRLRKNYDKLYPHGYLSKIKKMLQPAKKEEVKTVLSASQETIKVSATPIKISNNKHIIPADCICVNKQLGTGEFGIVQQGVWTNGVERIQVAIKCLCRERMQSNPMEFLKEAAIMHAIEHENIVRLYGVVLDTDSLMLVTELAHLRSLLECLKDPGLRVSFLTVPTLCEFAVQICNGMQYLESKRLIHRDLAARNILVFNKNKVKISDFGLSRALGVGKDYYQTNFNVNLKLPIAWCAPECINFLRFTNASDVWAYGVCLWEMFSYGFQPWAALTGHQILEAIDEPNYQRLEAPECCPREYYNLMVQCWQHDPLKRPKFSEIGDLLPDMRPEQVKTVQTYTGENTSGGIGGDKKDHLTYRQNEIIAVLDKTAGSPYWKGVLNSGKTGLFNPANTVTHLAACLPSSSMASMSGNSASGVSFSTGYSGGLTNRESFLRTADRCSKRKLRTEMISNPQNDLKHTGHVGLDGAYFGDVAFMSTSNATPTYNNPPRQIVTPYKPSEDIEQMPLLLPQTPTSADSTNTASGYFSQYRTTPLGEDVETDTIAASKAPTDGGFMMVDKSAGVAGSSNPFINTNGTDGFRFGNSASGETNIIGFNQTLRGKSQQQKHQKPISTELSHEYHEISDDEIASDKVFDMGPSLVDEMNVIINSLTSSAAAEQYHVDDEPPAATKSQAPNCSDEHLSGSTNPDAVDKTSKVPGTRYPMSAVGSSATLKIAGNKTTTTGSSKRASSSAGTVKAISMKDERILNQAIDYVNEISARSMTDLVADVPVAQSPKHKFSFRFPNLGSHSDRDASVGHRSGSNGESNSSGIGSGSQNTIGRTRNFSEELKNVSDLQNVISVECREAYNNLVEKSLSSAINHKPGKKFEFDTMLPTCSESTSANTTTLRASALSESAGQQQQQHSRNKPERQAPQPSCYKRRALSAASKITALELHPHAFETVDQHADTESHSTANSPSYILHTANSPAYTTHKDPKQIGGTAYSFSEKDMIDNASALHLNAVPLPPRDRNKIMQTNVKRHVRKYPLIIPLEDSAQPNRRNANASKSDPDQSVDVNDGRRSPFHEDPHSGSQLGQPNRNPHMDGNFPRCSAKSEAKSGPPAVLYENMQPLSVAERRKLLDSSDSASLHFEFILEDSCHQADAMTSPEVNKGFIFDIQKDNQLYRQKAAAAAATAATDVPDEYRNLDNIAQFYPKRLRPDKSDQVHLFSHEFTESGSVAKALICADVVDGGGPDAGTEAAAATPEASADRPTSALQHSNSVSCEDLLEFSDQKPKGRERGVESDEVRIMTKVLGTTARPAQFIEALDFIDWDVHKAIKLIKLRSTLSDFGPLTLQQCFDALQLNEWDMQITTLKMMTSPPDNQ